MGQWVKWSDPEIHQFDRYFKSLISQLTLYQKIRDINPNRSYDSISREIRRMRADGRAPTKEAAIKTLRVGYLDIEASGLDADFHFILSWYIKARERDYYDSAVITKKEIFDLQFDKRLVIELLKSLDNYDVIYTHWGVDRRFDIPFIRTRAYWHGLQDLLPRNAEKFILDTWPIAKQKLRLHSNRLDSIAECLGIDNVKKTPLKPRLWVMASAGDAKSLEQIALHNKRDVQLLERVHRKLEIIERPKYYSI